MLSVRVLTENQVQLELKGEDLVLTTAKAPQLAEIIQVFHRELIRVFFYFILFLAFCSKSSTMLKCHPNCKKKKARFYYYVMCHVIYKF